MSLFVPKDRKYLFRQFLAGMSDAVIITDPNGHVIEINPRAVELFGYEEDEVLDRHISFLVPRMAPDVVLRIRRAFDDDRHVMVMAGGRAKGGAKVACEISVSAIDLFNPGDLVFTLRCLEQRREVMNAFRAKANAFDLATVALFGCDTEGRIRDVNPAFCDLFDLVNVEEARLHTFADLMGDDPLPERFQQALNGEKSVTNIVADGDGEDKVALEITLAPNLHGSKNHGVVGCIRKV